MNPISDRSPIVHVFWERSLTMRWMEKMKSIKLFWLFANFYLINLSSSIKSPRLFFQNPVTRFYDSNLSSLIDTTFAIFFTHWAIGCIEKSFARLHRAKIFWSSYSKSSEYPWREWSLRKMREIKRRIWGFKANFKSVTVFFLEILRKLTIIFTRMDEPLWRYFILCSKMAYISSTCNDSCCFECFQKIHWD